MKEGKVGEFQPLGNSYFRYLSEMKRVRENLIVQACSGKCHKDTHTYNNNNNNNNNHGLTALYGPGPPLFEVTWSAHLWQFGDQPTGRAVQLNPDVTARAIWQAVMRLG
jgi:hypothetical protein